MNDQTHVIVGGGLAGATAAATLREEGFGGHVVLVAGEAEAPYERPPLSKAYLRGECAREKAHLDIPVDVELIAGVPATGLDAAARRLRLANGSELGYDRLLLATGAVPRRPPIPGAELDGVHVLRTLDDADAVRARLERGGPLVVIGAGWIGCEVTASARQMGAEVTMVDLVSAPLERVLGKDVGGWFARLHRGNGVRLALGSGVERLLGRDEVNAVVLHDGSRIEAAAVVLGTGVVPDTRLAETAGLAVDDGIVVDECLRTSAPGVYAAGDVANVRGLRVEHWDTAKAQGAAAARSMLGDESPYDRVPYFFSDQYDAGMEYVGRHAPGDRLVLRGSLDDASFQALWVAPDDRVTAAMHVDEWDSIGELRDLVGRRAPLTA